MLKKSLLSSLIILIHLISFSQSKYIYYFDDNINLVKKSKSVLKGVGVYENGSLELNVFDKKSKLLLSIWHFTDSTLQVTNGLFVTYYNKTKETEGSYLLGKKDGLWRKWNRVGKITDSSLYNNDEKIMQVSFGYYLDGKLMEINIDSGKEDKKEMIFYDESGNIVKPDFPKMAEDTDKIFTKTEIRATFPGGPFAWQHYVTGVIQNHLSDFNKKDYGTVLVKFIVDEDGTISEVQALTMKGTNLAKVAVDAIIKGPKWIAAQQNGRYVKSYMIQPFTLSAINF